MERDQNISIQYIVYYISTHTLTWSVTISADVKIVNNFISTHTLTWSVTFKDDIPFIYRNDFNSHAHVERDAIEMFLYT